MQVSLIVKTTRGIEKAECYIKYFKLQLLRVIFKTELKYLLLANCHFTLLLDFLRVPLVSPG